MEHKDRQLKSGSCHLWPTFYRGWCEKQWWSSCPTWQPDVYHPIYCWSGCWWSSPPGRSAEQAAQWQPGELSWIRALSTLAPPTPITWPGHSGWHARLSWLTNRLVLMFSSVFRLWDWTLSWILHSVIPQMQLLARLPKRDSPSLATRQAGSKVPEQTFAISPLYFALDLNCSIQVKGVIPYPRIGKRSQQTSVGNAVIPYPRVGRSSPDYY